MTSRSKFQQQLHVWWPAALVLLVGAVLSLALWQVLEKRQGRWVQDKLEQQAQLLSSTIEQRLHAYADYLQGVSSILALQPTSQHEVVQWLKEMPVTAFRHPGVEAVSIVRKLSPEDYASYQAQLAPSPGQEQVLKPLMLSGYYYVMDDIASTGVQRSLSALDIDQYAVYEQHMARFKEKIEPRWSVPQLLSASGGEGRGVWMSVPLYGKDALLGSLNVSLSVDALMGQLQQQGLLQNVLVAMYDTTQTADQSAEPFYASALWSEVLALQPLALAQRELHVLGRQWLIEFLPHGLVLSPVERWFPVVIALCAFGATLLLVAVILLLSLQRMRAQVQVQAQNELLRQRTDRFKALFHQSAIGVAEVDPASGHLVNINSRFSEMLGFDAQALEAKSLYAFVHADDREKCLKLEQQLRQGQLPHFNTTQRMVREDGSVMWVEIWQSPLLCVDGLPVGRFFVLLMDVTERCLMAEQLQAREAYSSEMLRYMPVGLVVVGPAGNIEFVNHQFEVMTGWVQTDMSDESNMWRHLCVDVQQHAALLQRLNAGRCEVVPTGVNMPAMEYLLRSKDGQELTMEVSGRFLEGRILLSFVDVSQRKAAEEEIRWLGYYDTLTQLPNRRMLLDRLEEAVVRSQRSAGHKGALLLLDIDNFKSLNETVGHDHGDALLRLVATRLSGCITGHHTLARQGGDEFAVVLEDLPTDSLEAGRCAEQVGCAILQALRTPFYLNNQDFHVTVSMGAVVFGGQGDSVEELLKRADLALYQAKSVGRDTLQFFDPRMQKAVSARVEMEKDMRLALERHEFDLFFQPQVQHDKVVGAEALLRWQHPTKGFIPPGVFVPAAEESGLILPLGEWVLYAACRQLADWAKASVTARLTMSVNVSPRQFYQPDFVEKVQRALQVTGAKATLLELELTEGMLLTDVEDTIRKMVQLKAIGVIFSLDDFGTGYSSLSYLKRLPLDKLKIDQSFVREVETSVNDATIARSIIALGNSLGLQVIAEGVETEAQRIFLAANGCSYWQGFFFSRPQPVDKFEAWVHAYNARLTVNFEAVE